MHEPRTQHEPRLRVSLKWMILAIMTEMMTVRIPAVSRRQAMDWSLVLVSQGIETTIDSTADSGWGLLVSGADHQRALDVLHQYRAENRHWPWRRKISPQGALFDWGSLGWVFLVSLFFWIQTHATPDFRDAGVMDAMAVSHGEWWRLFTAVFLHADIGHLAMNASIGLVLLGLTMGNFGTGLGLLAAYLAGVGGNIATWLIFSGGHRSLGASGMVMGCVGLLSAQSLLHWRRNPYERKHILAGIVGGTMLFILYGLSPGTDVLAHLGGFVSGLVLGSCLRLNPRLAQSTISNILAGIIFCLLVICPWWFALEH